MAGLAVSIDIGSTWTKGILVDTERGTCLARAETPTTQDDLTLGFEEVHRALTPGKGDPGTFISSSAKGGLRIAAIGIVPELTLKAAKMAAASGGGKIVAAFSYKLTGADTDALRRSECDIVLLSGGTDGGDEEHVLHNARMLAGARIGAAVLYAGNRAVRERVLAILEAGGVYAMGTGNILPGLDRIDIDGARRMIGMLFMDRIVDGKGLEELKKRAAGDLRPTPLAVYGLAALLGERMGDLLILDLGGATTDVYSVGDPGTGGADRLYRGIPEERVKRTVEGDLGLRSSAPNVLNLTEEMRAATGAAPERQAWSAGLLGGTTLAELGGWVELIRNGGAIVPRQDAEQRMDDILATVCVMEALSRHAGRISPAYTSSGLVWLQTGKDLTGISKVIGSGGRLARPGSYPIVKSALEYFSSGDGNQPGRLPQDRSLTPGGAGLRYFRDGDYTLTLAANLAERYPEAAVRLMEQSLREEG